MNKFIIFFGIVMFGLNSYAVESQYFKLSNGIGVYLLKNTDAPIFHHRIIYKIGSVDEENGNRGLAHLLEHLLFSGTKKYPEDAYRKNMSNAGARYNASTTFEFTNYYATAPLQYLENVLALESDRMVNLLLQDDKIAREKKVVAEERRQGYENNEDRMLCSYAFLSLFNNSNYRFPVIGYNKDFEGQTKDNIYNFYRSYYRPNNAFIIVSGGINFNDTKKLIEKYYGSIVNTKDEIIRQNIAEKYKDTANIYIKKQNKKFMQNKLTRYYVLDNFNNSTDTLTINMLDYIIGENSNSKLYYHFVKDGKMASWARSFYRKINDNKVLFLIELIPNEGFGLDDVSKELDDFLKNLANNILQEDIERGSMSIQAQIVYSQEVSSKIAGIYSNFILFHPDEDVFRFFDNFAKNINYVTLSDVRSLAKNINNAYFVETHSLKGENNE